MYALYMHIIVITNLKLKYIIILYIYVNGMNVSLIQFYTPYTPIKKYIHTLFINLHTSTYIYINQTMY